MQQGNTAAAFTAYESALAANQSSDPMLSNILQLKISQIKPADSVIETSETDSQEGDSQ
jgi:hypothetical protein